MLDILVSVGNDVWVDSPAKVSRYTGELEITPNWMHGTVILITRKGMVIVQPYGESIAACYATTKDKIHASTWYGYSSVNGYVTGCFDNSLAIQIMRNAIKNRKD